MHTSSRMSVAALLILLAACSNDDGAAESNHGMLGDCPATASTCPSGCYPITGTEVDTANDCLLSHQTVACWLGTGGANAQFGCIKDRDTGAKYVVGSTSYIEDLAASGKWNSCWTSASQPCP